MKIYFTISSASLLWLTHHRNIPMNVRAETGRFHLAQDSKLNKEEDGESSQSHSQPSPSSFWYFKKTPLYSNHLHVNDTIIHSSTICWLRPWLSGKNPICIHRLLDELINPNRIYIHLTVLYRWGLHHSDFDHCDFRNHYILSHFISSAAAWKLQKKGNRF